MKDDLYKHKTGGAGSFKFDSQTAAVFNNMAQRSIPCYDTVLELGSTVIIHHLLAQLERWGNLPASAQTDAHSWKIYDLGSSTGNLLHILAKKLSVAALWQLGAAAAFHKKIELVGVDNAPAMNTRARLAKPTRHLLRVSGPKFITADLTTWTFPPSQSICSDTLSIVLQYTLQFISHEHKRNLLEKIYHALRPGGIVLISEKIKVTPLREAKLFTAYYDAFKQHHGYNKLEIARKRRALENVLLPLTLKELTALLRAVGFGPPVLLHQWCSFVTLLVEKKG